MKATTGSADVWTAARVLRFLVLASFVLAVGVPTGWIPIIMAGINDGTEPVIQPGPAIIDLHAPTPTPSPLPPTPTRSVTRIGIIAGHSGAQNDPGAICPDGLQEVDINTDVARRVVAQLKNKGWDVLLLEEFDPRLNNFQADALVSIHSDSCIYPGKSGFKVARVESSYNPSAENRLVACLTTRYANRTGLQFDANTVTYDMTRYHAFYEIDPSTPAAIIEIGFMLDDRELLTKRADLIAQGIVEGVVCFIQGEKP